MLRKFLTSLTWGAAQCTDPVHPFVPSPDSNTPEPEPYVPENRERHSKHMRKLSVDSTDALPKAIR